MRHLWTIFGFLLIILIFGYVFFYPGHISGLQNTPASVGVAVPLTKVVSGAQSNVTRRANYLITSQDQLLELWKIIDANNQPPAVDFDTEVVVAVFAGQEPTAGYTIDVSKVADTATARMVVVSIKKPGGTCTLTEALTSPYEVLILPRTTLPFSHQDVATTAGCLN